MTKETSWNKIQAWRFQMGFFKLWSPLQIHKWKINNQTFPWHIGERGGFTWVSPIFAYVFAHEQPYKFFQHFNWNERWLACTEDYINHKKLSFNCFKTTCIQSSRKMGSLAATYDMFGQTLHALFYYDFAYKVLAIWLSIHWAIGSSHIKCHTMHVIKGPHVITTSLQIKVHLQTFKNMKKHWTSC